METLLKLLPVFIAFFAGLALQRTKILPQTAGDTLLKIVFYITVPALIVAVVIASKLSVNMLHFPLFVLGLTAMSYIVSTLLIDHKNISTQQRGASIISSMIINGGFVLPFIIAAYGQTGLNKFIMSDVTIGVLVFTWIYWIAIRHDPKAKNRSAMYKQLLYSPPLWAFVIALLCKVLQIPVPSSLQSGLTTIGVTTTVLVPIALGLRFSVKLTKNPLVYTTIGIRMVGGLLIGLLFVHAFGLTGIDRSIVLLLATAPIGYNAITLSSVTNLDTEFTATAVSISVALGLVVAPLIILFT